MNPHYTHMLLNDKEEDMGDKDIIYGDDSDMASVEAMDNKPFFKHYVRFTCKYIPTQHTKLGILYINQH